MHKVPGFPAYGVTDEGEVWTFWRRVQRGYVLADEPQQRVMGHPVGDGTYRQIRLSRGDGTSVLRQMHSVILEAITGHRPVGMKARHLDDDQSNNHPSNLAWGTDIENAADAIRNGRTPRGESHVKAVLTEEIVRQARRQRAEGRRISDLAREFGVDYGTLDAAIKRRTWRHVPDQTAGASR